MLTVILTIIGREIIALVLRTLTKRDLETEIEKIDFLRDGILHGIAKKLQPITDRYREIIYEERAKLGA